MEAYPSSNKQTNKHLKKERKTKNPSNHNVKQKNEKTNRQKPENVMNFDG
jgi:hypothetical protein